MTVPYLPDTTICDMSHWNKFTEHDLSEALAAGLVGVVNKVSQGVSRSDPDARADLLMELAQHVPLLGCYHFGDMNDPEAQASYYKSVLEADGYDENSSIEYMLDWEQNSGSTMPAEGAEHFVARMHSLTGRWPLLYTGKYGASGMGAGLPSSILLNCDLVFAGYGAYDDLRPHLPPGFRMPASDTDRHGVCRFWQFTDGEHNGGPFPGLGVIDQWRCIFSSRDALTARWGH